MGETAGDTPCSFFPTPRVHRAQHQANCNRAEDFLEVRTSEASWWCAGRRAMAAGLATNDLGTRPHVNSLERRVPAWRYGTSSSYEESPVLSRYFPFAISLAAVQRYRIARSSLLVVPWVGRRTPPPRAGRCSTNLRRQTSTVKPQCASRWGCWPAGGTRRDWVSHRRTWVVWD
jgi:hypothetical protein